MPKPVIHRALVLLVILLTVLFLPAEARAQAASPSGYRLIGTTTGKDFTGAVIDDGVNGQAFYRLRERLPDGSQVVKVGDGKVSIKGSDGVLYELFKIRDATPSSGQSRAEAGGGVEAPANRPASGDAPGASSRPGLSSRPGGALVPGSGRTDEAVRSRGGRTGREPGRYPRRGAKDN
jgi:hypothetical protein